MSVSAIVFPFAVALTSACAFLRISGFLISSTIAHSSVIAEKFLGIYVFDPRSEISSFVIV
ncbi:hypothetical protein Hdeb2414_s0014g00432121 [Helianthus debilis subsp. tardiflorus]